MESVPVIDLPAFETLKEALGAEFILELVQAFGVETPRLMASLRRAQAAGDAAAFRRLAHSIKASSTSLGALQLGELARQLEGLGRSGSLEAAAPALEQLERRYQEAWQALSELGRG